MAKAFIFISIDEGRLTNFTIQVSNEKFLKIANKAFNLMSRDIHESDIKNINKKASFMTMGACPDCGSGLQVQEGCEICQSCGYSKC
ncbi:MAG TPA: hypothetical protein ENI76_10110 [Ignavibacteria bacterium]|nr:hypothetical protein [Ignavibacteria bacterium]